MRVEGFVFERPGQVGDFVWMAKQPEYERSLFVFNDNEYQFLAHLDHVSGSGWCWAGGGNAAIRPLQCQIPVRACGIPTGVSRGYQMLDEPTQAIIDRAIEKVTETAVATQATQICYSTEVDGVTLGTGIFSVADEVKSYIVSRLLELDSQ